MRKNERAAAAAGTPRLVAYVRVSTDRQDLGPEAQRAAITAWAARQGLVVQDDAWYTDTLSGATPVDDRPGLMDALADLGRNQGSTLVAMKRDRFARDIVIMATLEALVTRTRGTVVTTDGVSTENTPEGMLMRGLLDLFAQYERAMIAARTKAALRAKMAAGWKNTGGTLAAPTYDPQPFIALASQGWPIARIAARLAADMGRPVTPRTVRKVLDRAGWQKKTL